MDLRNRRTWISFGLALVIGLLWWWVEAPDGEPEAAPPSASASPTAPVTPDRMGPAEPAPSASPTPNRVPGSPGTAKPSGAAEPTPAKPSGSAGRDPVSGLAWVRPDRLPAEARTVLVAIDNGGPFVREKDGSTFGNYEGVLPRRNRGYYREYTVPTPGTAHAGARRIVTGNSGEFYWTADHYASFARISR